MRFSVVIPTYNRAEMLRRTLESVRAQRFTDFELIVVDDGSTDETSQVLARIGTDARVLRQANSGPGAARNLGMKHASGEYVAFLDSDDLWFPWTLEVFAQLIERHNRPALLSGRLTQFGDDAELRSISEEAIEASLFPDFLASRALDHPAGSGTVVIRRDILAASGGFVTLPINGEDHDLVLRLGTQRGYVPIQRPVTLGWRRHPASTTTDMGRYVAGSRYLVAQELAGAYPGGAERARDRREIIGRHVRPVVIECARQRRFADAWKLYTGTALWNMTLGRWRYVLGFPFAMVWFALRSAR